MHQTTCFDDCALTDLYIGLECTRPLAKMAVLCVLCTATSKIVFILICPVMVAAECTVDTTNSLTTATAPAPATAL
jgi:hypothetical protein